MRRDRRWHTINHGTSGLQMKGDIGFMADGQTEMDEAVGL